MTRAQLRLIFIAVSDIVLAVSDASLNGFRAWLSLKNFVDFIKSKAKSYVKAEPYLIGNKIKYFGNNVSDICEQFLEVVEEDQAYLGSIQGERAHGQESCDRSECL